MLKLVINQWTGKNNMINFNQYFNENKVYLNIGHKLKSLS